jgi:acyl carrier protein
MKEAIQMEFEKIRDVIAEQMSVDKATITPNTSFQG